MTLKLLTIHFTEHHPNPHGCKSQTEILQTHFGIYFFLKKLDIIQVSYSSDAYFVR